MSKQQQESEIKISDHNVTNKSDYSAEDAIALLKKRDHIILIVDDVHTGIKSLGYEVTMPMVDYDKLQAELKNTTEGRKEELKKNLLYDIDEFCSFLQNDKGYSPSNKEMMEFGVDVIIASELGVEGIKIEKIVRTGQALHPINKHQKDKPPIYHGQVIIREIKLK